MVAADQLEEVTVGIAEVQTLVVFSPVDAAFNGNTMLDKVHLPLAHLRCLHGKSDMHGSGAIVWRNDASGICYWFQGGLFFEEQKNLVLRHSQCAHPIPLLEHDGKAEDLTVPFCCSVKIRHIKASFDYSAGFRYHNGVGAG